MILAVIILVITGTAAYKVIRHEHYQADRILNLSDQVDLLNTELRNQSDQIATLDTEIKILQNAVNGKTIDWEDDAYCYLAIGNSITWHTTTNYWWNEVGMAASSQDKDYVHVFAGMLEAAAGDVDVYAYNFSTWETQSNDRAETLPLLDPYLDDGLNIITIQLGENISDTTTLQEDFNELLQYIWDKCPNARVLVIGQYWQDDTIDRAKQDLCQATGAEFVDLSSMFADEISIYNAGMGATVYDADGDAHTVEHAGVSRHPGDAGMQEIARLLFAAYNHQIE